MVSSRQTPLWSSGWHSLTLVHSSHHSSTNLSWSLANSNPHQCPTLLGSYQVDQWKTQTDVQGLSDNLWLYVIKTRADELVALGKPLDYEDLIEKILEGLDDDYQPIVDAVNSRDTPISFDELHEKLINKELSLRQKISSSPLPVIANQTYSRYNSSNNRNHTSRSSWNPSPGPAVGTPLNNRDGCPNPRQFLGRCQWCSTQGHVVSQCLVFCQQQPNMQPPPRLGNHTLRLSVTNVNPTLPLLGVLKLMLQLSIRPPIPIGC